MPDFTVTSWDIAILLIYVIGTRLFFGWYIARKQQSGSEHYFLAGKSLTWPIIGLSFYVSNMSGSSFIGLPSAGYHSGVAVYHYEWLPALILIFFMFCILPFYQSAKVYTAPEFLEKRFGRTTRYMFSAFLLLANIFIDSAAALYAGATVIQTLFPGVSIWATVGAISALAGVYIFFGGLRAVVINDVLQAILIFAGGIVICVLAYMNIPSWEAVVEANADDALHLIRPASDDTMPWPGIFTGVLIVGIYFWCNNQFMIQRALGAKNMQHARWGVLFAGFLKLPNLFILILPGVMAVSLYPELERADLVFPTLAFDLLPVGWRGLMLAALAAAILSSLESILNSASTLFTMDFVKTQRPDLNDEALVRIGRYATLVFMILAALWAPQITHFPTLWQYLQSILAYITPPVVAVFLLGIFWTRASETAASFTLIVGVLIGCVGWVLNEIFELTQLHFLYACGLLFVFSCVFMIVVSLFTKASPIDKLQLCTWAMRDKTESVPAVWYSDYRLLSIALATLSLAIVFWWW